MKIRRIVTGSEFAYENVEVIYEKHSGIQEDIQQCFTHPSLDRVIIKTKEGEVKLITDWQSGYAEIKRMKPPACANKVKRLVICGEVSFSPAYLIPQDHCKSLGIPEAFSYQLSFVADGSLYICREQNISEITLI